MLLDLDETLIDRTQSIEQYTERFHRDFAHALTPIAAPRIAASILTADERGYRPTQHIGVQGAAKGAHLAPRDV
jgi:hypothetical protein